MPTVTRVPAGIAAAPRGFSTIQNWPPATASSVASGSVQIAMS